MDELTEILDENKSREIFENSVSSEKLLHPLPYKTSLLQGDLDNIILKSMQKEAERRYVSAEELSKDISNYLNGLPVTARPNTLFYKAAKFYSRNKTTSLVVILLLFSLILGIITTAWQAVIARRERDLAQQRFNDVRRLSNSLLFEITPKIELLQGSTEAREILVTRALEYLDSLSNQSQNDLGLQSELASAYEKVGDVQGNPGKPNLGNLEGGIKSFQKAQNIRLILANLNPADFETQRLLANNFNSIGDFRWWASDVEGSLTDYEKSIEILEKLLVQKSDDLQLNLDLLTSKINIIKVISYNGKYDESIKMNRDLLIKIEKLEEIFPESIELKRKKAFTFIRIGYDLSWQNRYDILDDYVKNSITLYKTLFNSNSNDARLQRDLNFAYFQAGGIYVEENPPLARLYLEKSIEISKRSVETDRLNYLAKFDLAQSYSKIGEVYQVEKKFDEAIIYLNKAGEILNELTLAEPKHEGYKFTLANNFARIAAAQAGKGDLKNAVENYQQTIERHELLRKQDESNIMSIRAIAVSEQDLADIFEKLNKFDKALVSYQKSVEMFNLLERRKGIGEYDKKNVEKSIEAVERLKK